MYSESPRSKPRLLGERQRTLAPVQKERAGRGRNTDQTPPGVPALKIHWQRSQAEPGRHLFVCYSGNSCQLPATLHGYLFHFLHLFWADSFQLLVHIIDLYEMSALVFYTAFKRWPKPHNINILLFIILWTLPIPLYTFLFKVTFFYHLHSSPLTLHYCILLFNSESFVSMYAPYTHANALYVYNYLAINLILIIVGRRKHWKHHWPTTQC